MSRRPLLCLLLGLVLLVGCWNRREIETLGFVIGAAFDWLEEESVYEVTAQLAQAGRLAPGGGGNGPSFTAISGRGKTIFDAVRNASKDTPRKLWWGHAQVIVIGEAAARRGMAEVLNWVSRDGETRLLYWVLLARGHAGELLRVKATAENVPALALRDLVRGAGATSTAPQMRVRDVFKALQSPSAVVLGVVGLNRNDAAPEGTPAPTFHLEGAGVIKGNHLVGYLDAIESRGVLWATAKVRSGLLTVPCPGNPERLVGVEITKAGAQTAPSLDRTGRLQLVVQVRAEGNVGDQECLAHMARPEVLKEVEERFEEAIRGEVEAALRRCRTLAAECLGLGTRVRQEMPRVWHQVEDRWHETFLNTPVRVAVQATVRQLGAEIRPLVPR